MLAGATAALAVAASFHSAPEHAATKHVAPHVVITHRAVLTRRRSGAAPTSALLFSALSWGRMPDLRIVTRGDAADHRPAARSRTYDARGPPHPG
jgi:hypothetical protein